MGIQKKLISLKYLIIREVQIKTRDSYIFIKLTKIRKQNNANVNKMLGYSDFHSLVMEVCSRTHTQGIIQTQLIKLRKSVPRDSKMGLLDMYFKKKIPQRSTRGHVQGCSLSRCWRQQRMETSQVSSAGGWDAASKAMALVPHPGTTSSCRNTDGSLKASVW